MGTPLKEYYIVEKMHTPQPMFTRSTMSINSWDFRDFEEYIRAQKNAIVKSLEFETRQQAEDSYEDPFLFPADQMFLKSIKVMVSGGRFKEPKTVQLIDFRCGFTKNAREL